MKFERREGARGGYIEVVRNHAFEDTMTVFCDEDGLRKKLPVNVLATELFDNGGGLGSLPIVGNVVVTGRTTEKGDTLGLTIEQTDIFFSDTDDLLNDLVKEAEKHARESQR